MEPQLFSDELIEIPPTSSAKGRMREMRVSSDLLSMGLQVYGNLNVNGAPDIVVIEPRTKEVIRVEVSGLVYTSDGKGTRPCGTKRPEDYDVLALVDEENARIVYKPDRFKNYRRYQPRNV